MSILCDVNGGSMCWYCTVPIFDGLSDINTDDNIDVVCVKDTETGR